MAGPFATECLFSIVRNTSGKAMVFGFLPPHGRLLQANEEFTVWGDARQAVIGGERSASRRNIQAFEAALSRGDMIIVHTPSPIFQDASTFAIKMARMNSGSLGLADPCWLTSGSIVEEG